MRLVSLANGPMVLYSFFVTWERARRPEQKEQRRAAIFEATVALLGESALSDVSLSAIARRSGVSKANLYRYFESREAIFIELLLARAASMVADFERALAPLAGSGDVERVADAIVASLVRHPEFVELFSAVSSVLERNVGAAAIRAFKRAISLHILRGINALHAAIPALSILGARRALTHVLIHAGGLWSSAHPAPHVAAVLDEPEFQALKLDYAETLRDHARVVLRGTLS